MSRIISYALAALALVALSVIVTGCKRDSYTPPPRTDYNVSCRSYLTTAEQLRECVRKSLNESSSKQHLNTQGQPATSGAGIYSMPTATPTPEDDYGLVTTSSPEFTNRDYPTVLRKDITGGLGRIPKPDEIMPESGRIRDGVYTLKRTLEEGRFFITATFEREEDIFRRGKEKCMLNLEVTEHMPEGYVNARVIRFEDAGCDGTVDLFWGDEIINRKPENEAYFRSRIDPEYWRWLAYMDAFH